MTLLPFVTPTWLRYLDLLEVHGADFGGDDLAMVAAQDELEVELELAVRRQLSRDCGLDFGDPQIDETAILPRPLAQV